jgi:hypothetical protein
MVSYSLTRQQLPQLLGVGQAVVHIGQHDVPTGREDKLRIWNPVLFLWRRESRDTQHRGHALKCERAIVLDAGVETARFHEGRQGILLVDGYQLK